MIKRLPSPSSFEGPYVNVDEFLNVFKNFYLPDNFQTFCNKTNYSNGSEKGIKRPLGNQQNSDNEEEGKTQTETAAMDIYKQRQQKKLVKQSWSNKLVFKC